MGGGSMRWAGKADYLGGVPRALVILAVGAFAKVVTSFFNSTSVYNSETLIRLVRSRPPGRPLITVSNHMSTLDDPLMWGFKGFPTADAKLARWVLAAEDICFKNVVLSYIFRLGKCIPITRGDGVYQAHMNEALEVLSGGGWLHTFPEGKVSQENAPIRRLKWGTASLIVRAPVTPLVLPIVHCGFEKVMPENYFFGRRPPVPLWNKDIKIIIGEPIEFDLESLKQTAKTVYRDSSIHNLGWPNTTDGLDEAAQKWLCIYISDQVRTIMERLRIFGATIKTFKPISGEPALEDIPESVKCHRSRARFGIRRSEIKKFTHSTVVGMLISSPSALMRWAAVRALKVLDIHRERRWDAEGVTSRVT